MSEPGQIHLHPDGSDAATGAADNPFRTVARAQTAVRRHPDLGRKPITVRLRGGTYYLDDTLVFTAEDSGTEEAPVTYAAASGQAVALSGGSLLELSWEAYRDGIYRTKTPDGSAIDELFVNGRRQPMARYPNFDPDLLPYNGYAADAFAPERVKRWADPEGGYIHAMHLHHWGGYHYRITGKNADGSVAYDGGWQNNRQMGMHEEYRFVENIFEELDAPGEWFHDAKKQALYYYPPEGLDLEDARVEATRLRHLVEFRGSQAEPVRHIRLRGLSFRHTARTFMETKEPLLRSDWTVYRGGAVLFGGAEDCALDDCEFDQVGGNAVFADGYNRRLAVRGTHIHGAGASAVCFVGDPDAVRDPLFEYNERQAYGDIDKTPGPKSDAYPGDCLVEDCLIHDIGLVEKQATGVQVSMARGITVRHCSIYDVGRAGINISEGTFGGHVLEYCDVFDTVRETGDHGSFNSWGRDRFWGLEGVPPGALPGLALLDAEKSTIRNSRWRCDRGWDVDLDDGSSNYEIYNNVFLRGGLKLREGFYRKVYNNIAINSSLHAHVWYPGSGDELWNNIWTAPYPDPIQMPEGEWGGSNDRNLFVSKAALAKARGYGWDRRSVACDPMFVDPEKGDYRVKAGSPALELGFENFPMDRFGVQKPALKAIARTPELPALDFAAPSDGPEEAAPVEWMGAALKELAGEEFSSFGVRREDGGMHVQTVPTGSAASAADLRSGDLILSINGRRTPVAETFLEVVESLPAGEPVRLGVVRYQNSITVEF